MENNTGKKPNKSITIFLIFSTMLLSVALFACGVYALYISIGFKFIQDSTYANINTTTLYTYPNSVYGTGTGTMVGLIIVSLVMLALGIGVSIIFFKQLPLYKQIKLVNKLPSVKYQDYSKKVKKSVIVYSIIAYVICIAFSIFSIIVATKSGIANNYLGLIITLFSVVLALSIASMVLMIVKVVQLTKIKKKMKMTECDCEIKDKETKPVKNEKNNYTEDNKTEKANIITEEKPIIIEHKEDNRLFSDGIFELGDQLQKLREMHISGLIDADEYMIIREKWINAMLSEPLFGKKHKSKTKKKNPAIEKQETEISKIIISQ